uniref:Ribosomal protein S11 n=1 Tax=Nitzschia sp. NIES-3576 TaxID=2083273 RepID=A0A2Z5ZB05_9STRA|nr:ribosomal protein S11 [Nitzschia sp. NIES-3576]
MQKKIYTKNKKYTRNNQYRNIRRRGHITRFPKIIVYIHSTFNNTLVTLIRHFGKTISWSSSGKSGFKNSKKKLSFAAQCTIDKLKSIMRKIAFNKLVKVVVKGQGLGRETSIRSIKNNGFLITSLQDRTPIAYNGCRSPKSRRL